MDAKVKLRAEIWNALKERGLTPPEHTFGRIPRFRGAGKAATMLRNTPEWEISRIIFCSPDSAQREVRQFALRDGKVLIMASPKLKRGYLLIDPQYASGHEKSASTIKGAFKYGRTIDKFPKVDLMVEGSVAVDLSGGRLGKGGGYGDQEIEHLFKEKAISGETPIVTTVHEAQIVDKIPLEPHDKNINMIITPERVIRI